MLKNEHDYFVNIPQSKQPEDLLHLFGEEIRRDSTHQL